MIRVHSYESLGTYDGPGIRLVVFLQGCNFRCLYCANPDTIDAKGESKETAPEEILKMAVSQKPFFGKKGGITFSGGEPTFQAKALVPLFRMLKDLVLLDVKEFNDERHKALTSRSNAQTLKTAAWLEENQKPFWLRYVLVQKYSYFKEDIEALGEHFKDYRMIERVEILPYHTLGVHKYEAMKMDYQLKDVQLNTQAQLDEAKELFEKYFRTVYIN